MRSPLWILLIASPALAQPTADDTVARAKQMYAEGKRYYDIGDYAHAIDTWKLAYIAANAPMLLFNIAQAYRLSGNCTEAMRMYASYEHAAPDLPNRDDVEQAKARCIREPTKTHAPGELGEPPEPSVKPPVAAPVKPSTAEYHVDPARGGTLRTAGIATGAAGAALAITSYVFARRASNLADQVAGYRGEWTATQQGLDHDGQTARTLSLTTGIAGALGLVGGAALYYAGWRDAHTPHLEVSIGPSHTEVLWSASF